MKSTKKITNKFVAALIIFVTISSLSLNSVTAKSSTIKVTKVTINKVSTLYVGNKTTLKATVTPSKASNKNLTWKSSNSKIIKVVDSSKGTIQALKAGKATITATAKDGSGKKASITINVKKCNHTTKNKEITKEYTSAGHIVQYRCKVCKQIISKSKDPEKHTFSSWETTKEPTETEFGEQTRSCVCGYSQKRKVKLESKYENITKELDGVDVLYITNAIDNGNTYTLQGVIYTQYILSEKEFKQIVSKGSFVIDGEEFTLKINNLEELLSEDYYLSYPYDYLLYSKRFESPMYRIKRASSKTFYLEAQAQIEDVWKLTDKYKEITVSKDTKCSLNWDYEGKYKTVKDVFNNYKASKPVETTRPNDDNTFIFKFENGKCIKVESELTSLE